MANLKEIARKVRQDCVERPNALKIVYKQGRSWEFASLDAGGAVRSDDLREKVEIIRLPDKASYKSIRIGSTYDLDFEARTTRNGVFLALVGMEYVDPADDYEAARSA